jgi:predicted RNA binding protein YcfA (HicA-like mRNA interferase family)
MVLKKFILVMFLLFILTIGLILLRFGSALFQEGNPTPILTSIINLELQKSDYELFSETNIHNKYVSENTGIYRYDVIKEFMKEKGWDFKEQMGSGLVFKKDEQTIVVETRQYSKHYILWNIPKEVLS